MFPDSKRDAEACLHQLPTSIQTTTTDFYVLKYEDDMTPGRPIADLKKEQFDQEDIESWAYAARLIKVRTPVCSTSGVSMDTAHYCSPAACSLQR